MTGTVKLMRQDFFSRKVEVLLKKKQNAIHVCYLHSMCLELFQNEWMDVSLSHQAQIY